MALGAAMIVVDTSVWAAFFNGEDRPEVAMLDDVLRGDEEDVVTVPIVLTEVLMGFRTETGFRRAARMLLRLARLDPTPRTCVAAARLYRTLRGRGVTVRGAVDCLIAVACIETGARLLTLDRDFTHIARHTPLRLARPAVA
jgi:predicted nucleic acid-binding protein